MPRFCRFCQKRAYPTQQDAESSLAKIQQKHGWTREVRTYRCDARLLWHLTKRHSIRSLRKMQADLVQQRTISRSVVEQESIEYWLLSLNVWLEIANDTAGLQRGGRLRGMIDSDAIRVCHEGVEESLFELEQAVQVNGLHTYLP